MEHLRDEAHCRWLIGIFLCELERQLERAILEWRFVRPEYDSVPDHYIVVGWRATDANGWIFV